MKKAILASVLAAVTLAAAPALADPPPWAPAHGRRAHEQSQYQERYEDQERYQDQQRYQNHDAYRSYQPRRGYDRPLGYNDRVWRGNDGRTYCHRSDGSTGLVIGAGLGALAGSAIASNRDQTLGIILGALGGGVAGRSIERRNIRCR